MLESLGRVGSLRRGILGLGETFGLSLALLALVMASSLAMMVYVSVRQYALDRTPPENILVLQKGARWDFEARSEIDRAVAGNVISLPGIRRDGNLVLATRDQVAWITVGKDRSRYQGPVVLRSIDDATFDSLLAGGRDALIAEWTAFQASTPLILAPVMTQPTYSPGADLVDGKIKV